MLHDKRSALSSYVSGLLASGRTVFTAEEAEQALGVGRGAFLDAAERLQRRKALLRRGRDSMSSSHRNMRPGGHRHRPGTSMRSCAARARPRWSPQGRGVARCDASGGHGVSGHLEQASSKGPRGPQPDRLLLPQGDGSGDGRNRGPQDRYRHDEDLVSRADGPRSAALSAGVRRNRQCCHGPLGPRTKDRSRATRRLFAAGGAAGRATSRASSGASRP